MIEAQATLSAPERIKSGRQLRFKLKFQEIPGQELDDDELDRMMGQLVHINLYAPGTQPGRDEPAAFALVIIEKTKDVELQLVAEKRHARYGQLRALAKKGGLLTIRMEALQSLKEAEARFEAAQGPQAVQ